MNIELSGKNKTVADGITVAELIAQEQLDARACEGGSE